MRDYKKLNSRAIKKDDYGRFVLLRKRILFAERDSKIQKTQKKKHQLLTSEHVQKLFNIRKEEILPFPRLLHRPRNLKPLTPRKNANESSSRTSNLSKRPSSSRSSGQSSPNTEKPTSRENSSRSKSETSPTNS